jgi:hypothetical protein
MASLPSLSQFAAVSYAATRASSSPAWERLDAPTQALIMGRVRYGLDYLAGGEAGGVIYAVSPSDPPPTRPAE